MKYTQIKGRDQGNYDGEQWVREYENGSKVVERREYGKINHYIVKDGHRAGPFHSWEVCEKYIN